MGRGDHGTGGPVTTSLPVVGVLLGSAVLLLARPPTHRWTTSRSMVPEPGTAPSRDGVVAALRAAAGWAARRLAPGAVLGERDAALAAELVAAVVEAGVPLAVAVSHVAAALPGPVGEGLARAERLHAVGASPRAAFAPMLTDPATMRLARGLVRAQESGLPPVPVLAAAATMQRDRLRSVRLQRARGAGSRAAVPLGLCFLPAFLLVAVVPVLVGGFGAVVTGR
jgi:hypothetical protein